MICTCGGVLMVIRVEEIPEDLPKHKRLNYNRVCDVQCMDCQKIYYSQAYDFGSTLNKVKKL